MLGERLKLARNRAGLSLRDLEAHLDGRVTAQSLSKYERGDMNPTSEVLTDITRVLGLPTSFFLSPVQARLDGVEFRRNAGTTKKDRARVEAEVLHHVERYLLIEEILDLDSAHWVVPLPEKKQRVIQSADECEQLVNEIRQEWELGFDPIPDISQLLERHGIKVMWLDLPQGVSGLTCLVARDGQEMVPCIVVNQNTNLERRRFTLAHELAHRLIHDSSPQVEKLCQRFAGAFLVPAEHLIGECGRRRRAVGRDEVLDLKSVYGVSAAALLMRLEQVGIISSSALEYAFKRYANRWRKEEPKPMEGGEGSGKSKVPTRFERLCYRALVEEIISLPKAAELLVLPTDKIEENVRGAKDSHAADG